MTDRPRWVALGSSFAAGPGITPLTDRGAMRSGRNYAALAAGALGADLVDVTCSGATTAHLLSEPQRTLTGARPPQLEAVGADATYVSITVGGNDLNFVGALTVAAARSFASTWMGRARIPRGLRPTTPVEGVTDAQVDALVTSYVEIVEQVRTHAPEARVLFVDYLTLLGDDPEHDLGLAAADVATLRDTEIRLAGAFATAAHRTGADLVAVSRTSRSHGYASVDPWVTGFSFGLPWRGEIPFHPNAAGMQHAADELVQRLS